MTNYDQLKQLLLLEEFKNCLPNDLKIYLNDHNVDTLCHAARCADEYTIRTKTQALKLLQNF